MFGRKKIVVGKNYLYDVMNETDMADIATLVTVIKKCKKKNKYMVMSVNNNQVFETDACFLFPYTNPKEASVIRCQYGTLEFSKNDIITLQEAITICNITIDMLKMDPEHTNDVFQKTIAKMTIAIDKFIDLQKKILPYAQITEYKNLVNDIHKSKLNISKLRNVIKKDRFKEFQNKFEEVVAKYASKDISVNDFVCNACSVFSYSFPLEVLYNKNGISFSKNYLLQRVNEIIEDFDNGYIVFIIGIDKNGITTKPIYRDDFNNFEDLIDFFNCLYPNIFEDEEGYEKTKPTYVFEVIKVKNIEKGGNNI